MQVFLIGATGFVGSVIAEKLAEAGHQILALERDEDELTELTEAGYEVVAGDLADLTLVGQGAAECDAVVYAASGRGPDWHQIERAAARMLIEAVRGSRRPVCFVGSSLVFGDTGNGALSEEAPFHPPAFMAQRAVVEQMLLDAAPQARTMLVHGALVYGRGDGALLRTLLEAARKEDCGHFVGRGDQRWSACHVDDLAELVVRALNDAPAGTRIAAADTAPTMREIAEAVSDSIGAAGRTRSITLDEARRMFGFFGEPMAMHQYFRGDNARTLGWRPHFPLLADELNSGYYALPGARELQRIRPATSRLPRIQG